MTRSATENTGWIKEFSRFRKGIVYRLLVGMLLIANLAVILILSFHMHDDYRTRIREIHTQFDHIRDAVLPGLTNSLWISDQEQIQLLLESAEHLFYIEYLELRTNEQEIYRTGKQVSKHVLSRDFDLAYDHGNRKLFLGTLSATASLDKVYDTLWANAKTDIVSHGLIILLLALVILFLFDNLVTRHLVRMAAYARELDIDRLDAESLKLDRNFPAGSKDELEEMVSAFNHMMRRLADSTEELKTANEQLLEEINERRKTAEENEKLENHLRQAQKMEAVGTMAGGIAHDFNNILTIIIGNTELAMDDTPNDGPVRIYLDAILSASHRAKELIKQILAFSRRDTVSKKPFYLCRLVEETMKVLRATIPTTVEIKVTTPAKCRENITECYKVLVDPTQIHQLLMNLCMNAVQAMDEKGVLQVCVDEKIIGDAAAADLQGLEPGVYAIFMKVDNLFRFQVPGMGFVVTMLSITAVGFVASNYVARKLLQVVESLFSRLPLVKMIYSSIKDLIGAFVGDKKSFTRPVLVQLSGASGARAIGFVTSDDLAGLGIAGSVAVYLPQSYNFAGNLIVVSREQVSPLEADPGDVMSFVVSGGVSSGQGH